MLDVVVDDAVLAEASAGGGAGAVAERDQNGPRAGVALQGLGDPLDGIERLEREDDRLGAVRARLGLHLVGLHAGAQSARELRAERSGHAAGDLVVVDDEKDAKRVGGPGGGHGERILFAAAALGPGRRAASVTNARRAAP